MKLILEILRQVIFNFYLSDLTILMKNKKLLPKDQKLKSWLKQGGREGAKPDFLALIKKAAEPLKT